MGWSLIVGTDQWNSEPQLHDARSGIGAATTASGQMCTGGGEVPGKPTTVSTIECFKRGRWHRVATVQVPTTRPCRRRRGQPRPLRRRRAATGGDVQRRPPSAGVL